MQRLLFSLIAAAALLIVVALTAIGQTGSLAGLLHPSVINIDQDVPVDVTLALPQADGSVITATAPITVGVQLRITIDGAQVVSAVVPATTAQATPAITIERPTPAPVVPGDELVYGAVRWQLDKATDIGSFYDDPYDTWREIETAGTLVEVEFTVENIGIDPGQINFGEGDSYQVMLQDDAGRRFGPTAGTYNEDCDRMDLNPGISAYCRIIYEVPSDATGLSVVFVDDSGATSIPLGL